MENLKLETKNNSLEIIAVQNAKLEKEHLQFNKLCKTIERLQKEITATENKLQGLLDYYLLNNRPHILKFSEYQMEMIALLDHRSKEIKLSNRQTEILGFTITEIFESAMTYVKPSEELISIFNRWSPEYTYEMRVEEQGEELKEELSSIIWEAFGLDIDPNEMNDSEESLKNLEFKFKEFLEHQESSGASKNKSSKKFNKIQLEKAKEELQEKSIRKIYLALAKILHPDVQMNEHDKLEREQIMKLANQAYENKDLYTLLKLEMKWMNKNPETLTDINILKLYIQVLNDQVLELREKKYFIKMDPKWVEIMEWVEDSEKNARYKMDYIKELQEKKLKISLVDLEQLKTTNNPRHFIISMIKEFEPAFTLSSNFKFM